MVRAAMGPGVASEVGVVGVVDVVGRVRGRLGVGRVQGVGGGSCCGGRAVAGTGRGGAAPGREGVSSGCGGRKRSTEREYKAGLEGCKHESENQLLTWYETPTGRVTNTQTNRFRSTRVGIPHEPHTGTIN